MRGLNRDISLAKEHADSMESSSTQPKRSRDRASGVGASFISSSFISKSDVSKIIDQVKHKIESSLKFYMTTEQILERLKGEGIPHWLTLEVWKALREQNHDFFVAYSVRLKLIEQITKFNELLEHQKQLMMPNAAQPSFPIATNHHLINPMPDLFQNAATGLDMGFPLPQQNLLPLAEQPYLNPIGSGLSSYHGVYGIPAMNNPYPNEMNYIKSTTQATILAMGPGPLPAPTITMDLAAMASAGSFPANRSGVVPSIHAPSNQAATYNQAYVTDLQPGMESGPENPMTTSMTFGDFPEI